MGRVAVSGQTGSVPVLGGLWRRLDFVWTFLALGVVVAVLAWLAVVSLPALGSLAAAVAGLDSAGTTVAHAGTLALAVLALVGGGLLADRAGDAAVGIGTLIAGVGTLAFAFGPGTATTALFALCATAGVGVVLPGLLRTVVDRGGTDRAGLALALVGAGYLLPNALVVSPWYRATWLGLGATTFVFADGLVLVPRALVYEAVGSWEQALVLAGGGLLAASVGQFLGAGRPALRSLRHGSDGGTLRETVERVPVTRWLAVAAAGWTGAAALAVYAGIVDTLTAPIVALAGRLIPVVLLAGVLVGGVVLDRLGPRRTLGGAFAGAVAGPLVYSTAAGPATESVVAAPPGTPLVLAGLLVTGLAVGTLVVCLFALVAGLAGEQTHERVGTLAGVALAVVLVAALLARVTTGAVGRASSGGLLLLTGPAAAGIAALWLPDHADGEGERR